MTFLAAIDSGDAAAVGAGLIADPARAAARDDDGAGHEAIVARLER